MLRVGLIGCGFMGSTHANCYKVIDGAELVAVADLRREKAEAAANGTNAVIYADGAELIAKADVDIIDICLPTYLHTEYALLAMDKVKYLFIEKPVALTAEEGKALIEKSKATGCKVQVGHVVRFKDEYEELKRIVESGVYGKVVNASFRRLSPRPGWGWNNWLLDSKLSGGAGQDLHIHDVDYVLSVFGTPKNLYSLKNIKGETNSYVNTLLQYDDFVVGVEGTWDLPTTYSFSANFRVVFEKATVENAGGKFMLYTNEGASEIKIEKKVTVSSVKGGNLSDLGGHYKELAYFCERAEAGEEIERAALVDSVASLEFIIKELNFGA